MKEMVPNEVNGGCELSSAVCDRTSAISFVDPFGSAKPRLSRRGRKAPLRVNPEQAPAFMPGSRRVDFRFRVSTVDGSSAVANEPYVN